VRRRRALTLARLKEEARVALRDLARAGEAPRAEALAAVADRLAPRDEDELFALSRATPALRPDVRAGVLSALVRVLEDERRAIEKGGADYLDLQDKNPCCGG
jgi:hypothetical protein